MQFGSRWLFNLILISLLSDYDFGVFAYVLALANILMGTLPFGSTTFILGEVDSADKLKQLSRTIALILVLFVVTLILYLALLPFQIEHYELLIFGIFLGLVYSLNLIIFFFLKSIGQFKEEIKGSALMLILTLIVLAYFYFGKGELKIEKIFIFSIVLNSLVVVYTLFSKYIPFKTLLKEVKGNLFIPVPILKERLYYGLQELMTTSYTQIGIFVMFYFLDAEVYGIFRKIFIVIAPILLFVVTFSQVLLHHLRKVPDSYVVHEFRRYFKLMLGIAFTVMIALWIFKSLLLGTFAKLTITPQILQAYAIVVVAVGIRFLFVNYEMLLVRFAKQNIRFWVMFTAMVTNFISIIVLTPTLGLLGAVLVDIITNGTILVGLVIVGEKQIKKEINS